MTSTVGDDLHAELALLCDLVAMDVAMITEVQGTREIARRAAGSWGAAGSLEGGSIRYEETFCAKLLAGEIDNVVVDTARDPRVRDLEMALNLGVGAWMGIPVRAVGGRRFVLCCLSRQAHPELGDGELEILRSFLERILPRLLAQEIGRDHP